MSAHGCISTVIWGALMGATTFQINAGEPSKWLEGKDVVVDTGEIVRLAATTPVLGRVTVRGTVEFSGADAVLKASSLTVETGGLITHSGPVVNGEVPARVAVECAGSLAVAENGRISADGRGFAGGAGNAKDDDASSAGHGPGAGGYPKIWGASAGGSHGGKGGTPSAKEVYGKAKAPVEAGSGGGGGGKGPRAGAGGGIIRIQAQDVVVDGTISADGTDGTKPTYGGGGSGGSVWIRCSSITGNGCVRADGGSGSRYAGGGGGGRIAVQFDKSAQDRAPASKIVFSVLGGANGIGEAYAANPDAFGWPGTMSFTPETVPGSVQANSCADAGMAGKNPTVAYWMPWRVNPPLAEVRKEIYIKQPRRNAAALASRCYVGPGLQMREIQGLEARDDVHTGRSIRFSEDNGRTWTPLSPWPDTVRMVSGIEVWEDGGACLFDDKAGVLVDVWLRQIQLGNIWADGTCNCFTYYRFSRDYGRTWSEPKQLRYEEGTDFDPAKPTRPEFLLKNQAYYGNNIIRHSNGTLITAVVHANAPNDPKNDVRAWKLASLCFVGTWDEVLGDYKWKAGGRVEVPDTVSSRGLMEPAVAELKDGRVLVVWRGSNTATTPGRKWFSLSSDGGLTLSPPAEWKYDDGTRFYSPSSIHQFVRHGATGKLYWAGNITFQPPEGNGPRYPLVLAEVDETDAAIRKNTVTLIDDRPDSADFNYQLSNFSFYENRETRNLELILTTYGQEAGQDNWMNADCWRYELIFRFPDPPR